MMSTLQNLIEKNGLIVAFLLVGILTISADWASKRLFKSKIPGSALAIFFALVLGYLGGLFGQGKRDYLIFPGSRDWAT